MTASIYPPRTRAQRTSGHAWIEIDLDAVRANATLVRARAGVPLVAMVKADAYGLGAVPVARALGASFADSPDSADDQSLLWGLGVATIAEARELRDAGCTARLLCCTPLAASELAEAVALQLRPSLHTVADITGWHDAGGGPWHLAIDTGIARAGIRWDAVALLRPVLEQAKPEGVFTHFHSAERDDGSRELQEARFGEACATLHDLLLPSTLMHSDNSAAIARRGRSDANLVRPGIALYGAGHNAPIALEQTVHLRARVVDLRDVHAGESVGYGATWTATAARRIATVPVGYADGYRRDLSNCANVLVHGRLCPVVGRISMDTTTIDVTDVPCTLGDVVTMIGADGGAVLTTDAVAEGGGLSPYELLIGLRLRLPRIYVGGAFGELRDGAESPAGITNPNGVGG